MMAGRIVSFLVLAVLLISSISVLEMDVDGKDGSFGGGSGTLNDPYVIEDVWDLQAMEKDLTAHYILKNDINAIETKTWNSGTGFIPVGNNSKKFTGSLDGKGYKITGLYINRFRDDYQGLLGYVGNDGVVKDVILLDVNITGHFYIGGLVGFNNGTILNCSITGNVKGSIQVGGLVGYNRLGMLSNCYATCTVRGENHIGGLVGDNYKGTVTNCNTTGAVSGFSTVGGLMGWSNGNSNNCFATGTVSGSWVIGGLVGWNYFGIVSNSYAIGDVTGSWGFVGGLVGLNNQSVVSNCYAKGMVSGRSDVGGLLGSNNGTVTNCYAIGAVNRLLGSDTKFGGFVGFNDKGKVLNCYSIGRVIYEDATNPTDKGFTGSMNTGSGYEMKGNFWDTQTSGQTSTTGNAIGKNTTGMMTMKTFEEAGWDIVHVRDHVDEVWYIDDSYDYPRLGWEYYLDTHSPIAVAGPDQTVRMGETVFLNGSKCSDNIGIISYTWEFMDGGSISLSGMLQLYRFDNAGVFVVTLNVTDSAGNWDTDTLTVTVLDTQAPVADAGPDQVINMGETAHFNASLSRDNVGIASYVWTFTDEVPIVLTGILQSYLFDNAGFFLVTLNITDAAGSWVTDKMTVTVKDIAVPVANAGSDIIIDEGTTVTFDGTLSSDNVGIVNFTWTFMDRRSITLFGPTPDYLFNNPGVFIVTLNVTDTAGNWATAMVNVTVRDITSPIAKAGFDQRVAIGSEVIFDGSLSTDNVGILRYSWKFNYDGADTTLEGGYVQFKFDKAGTYEVELTVYDAYDNSGKDVIVITVVDTGIVKGIVFDSKGNPVEGAKVEITASNGEIKTTTTGANGSFSLVVFHGNFNWSISKEGYKSISGSYFVKPMEVTELDLTEYQMIKEDEEEDYQSIVLIIVLAVIVVLILGTVLFMLFRKKGLSIEPGPEKGLDIDKELERDE